MLKPKTNQKQATGETKMQVKEETPKHPIVGKEDIKPEHVQHIVKGEAPEITSLIETAIANGNSLDVATCYNVIQLLEPIRLSTVAWLSKYGHIDREVTINMRNKAQAIEIALDNAHSRLRVLRPPVLISEDDTAKIYQSGLRNDVTWKVYKNGFYSAHKGKATSCDDIEPTNKAARNALFKEGLSLYEMEK